MSPVNIPRFASRAFKHIDKPGYRALVLMRTAEGVRRFCKQHPPLESYFRVADRTYVFPSGAIVRVDIAPSAPHDFYRYDGQQFQFIDARYVQPRFHEQLRARCRTFADIEHEFRA